MKGTGHARCNHPVKDVETSVVFNHNFFQNSLDFAVDRLEDHLPRVQCQGCTQGVVVILIGKFAGFETHINR